MLNNKSDSKLNNKYKLDNKPNCNHKSNNKLNSKHKLDKNQTTKTSQIIS